MKSPLNVGNGRHHVREPSVPIEIGITWSAADRSAFLKVPVGPWM
jgi:hypothetical protein